MTRIRKVGAVLGRGVVAWVVAFLAVGVMSGLWQTALAGQRESEDRLATLEVRIQRLEDDSNYKDELLAASNAEREGLATEMESFRKKNRNLNREINTLIDDYNALVDSYNLLLAYAGTRSTLSHISCFDLGYSLSCNAY